MHPLLTLLAVAASARPGVALPVTIPRPLLDRITADLQPVAKELLPEYAIPRYLLPYVDLPRNQPQNDYDWLTREIDRLNLMELGDEYENYDPERREDVTPVAGFEPQISAAQVPADERPTKQLLDSQGHQQEQHAKAMDNKTDKFAYTPLEKGYYKIPETEVKHEPKHVPTEAANPAPPQRLVGEPGDFFEIPRQIRQNPNLSKTKTLVAENLGKLRTGVAGKEYRVPVSLLPTNLRWLKISQPDDKNESTIRDDEVRAGQEHRGAAPPTTSIYGVAVIAAIGAALSVAALGFAFGLYTLSKKAKAAADVDYPAYGVTGPTLDHSGDRKLAHSAHMYHYQHQKQQILAMERNGGDPRDGSVSDPESEDENEEGDYTVYECPGLATTGDMEVKNPMFSEDPTPMTPAKCELVKPQLKE